MYRRFPNICFLSASSAFSILGRLIICLELISTRRISLFSMITTLVTYTSSRNSPSSSLGISSPPNTSKNSCLSGFSFSSDSVSACFPSVFSGSSCTDAWTLSGTFCTGASFTGCGSICMSSYISDCICSSYICCSYAMASCISHAYISSIFCCPVP